MDVLHRKGVQQEREKDDAVRRGGGGGTPLYGLYMYVHIGVFKSPNMFAVIGRVHVFFVEE